MTDINWGQLEAFTRDIILPRVFDQVYTTNPVFTLLDGKGIKEKSGKNIRVLVEYAKNTLVSSYEGLDPIPTTRNQKAADTYLPWKQYQAPIVIAGDEEFKNAGAEQIEDLVQFEINSAKKSIQDSLGTALYTDGSGNSDKDLTGFKAAIDDSSNTDVYAGITRSTSIWWKSRYTNWAAVPVSIDSWQTEFGALTDGSIKPDYVFTTQAIYNKCVSLIVPSQRTTDTKLGAAGFDTIMIHNRGITVDSHCGSGDAWVVNSDYISMVTAKGRNFSMDPWQRPVNQDARISHILWAGNLVNESCLLHGHIHSINVSL